MAGLVMYSGFIGTTFHLSVRGSRACDRRAAGCGPSSQQWHRQIHVVGASEVENADHGVVAPPRACRGVATFVMMPFIAFHRLQLSEQSASSLLLKQYGLSVTLLPSACSTSGFFLAAQ